MEKYKNLGGKSGVIGFRIQDSSITVVFSDGYQYQYDFVSPGSAHVNKMKQLAQQHQGLNSYIMANEGVRHGWRMKKKPNGDWENNADLRTE